MNYHQKMSYLDTLAAAKSKWKELRIRRQQLGGTFDVDELEIMRSIVDKYYFPDPEGGVPKYESHRILRAWVAPSKHGTFCVWAAIDGAPDITYGANNFRRSLYGAKRHWKRKRARYLSLNNE